MMLINSRFALFAIFFVLCTAALTKTGNAGTPDKLILNDGEIIQIILTQSPNDALVITKGEAQRVPVKPSKRPESEQNTVELDISSRNLSLKTSAAQFFVSGAKQLNIKGFNLPNWGSYDRPVLFIDRDCRVTLSGQASACAFVEVHPLAIASVDARGLAIKEIVIIGNAKTKVFHQPGAKVSFLNRESDPEVRTSGYTGDWTPTPDVVPTSPPSAPTREAAPPEAPTQAIPAPSAPPEAAPSPTQ